MSALTKIFIVLQLVCSLVVAVVLVGALKSQENYKKDSEARNAAWNQAQAAVQKKSGELAALQAQYDNLVQEIRTTTGTMTTQINDLRREKSEIAIARDVAQGQIAVEGNKVAQLTAANESLAKEIRRVNAENARLAPKIATLTQQNAELTRVNNEILTRFMAAEQSIRKLQEALTQAQASKGGAAVTAEAGTVAMLTTQTPAQINGKVTRSLVSPGRTLVEVGLGARDGVKEGARYVISRNGTFIADAIVEHVTPDASVAATTNNIVKGETVMAGDLVTSGAPQ